MRKLKPDELNCALLVKFKRPGIKCRLWLLDNVRSMHNIGSIFRTADGFAVEKNMPVRRYRTATPS